MRSRGHVVAGSALNFDPALVSMHPLLCARSARRISIAHVIRSPRILDLDIFNPPCFLYFTKNYHTPFIGDLSGTITLIELKEVMKSLGQNPTEKELTQMIRSVDDNGDNEIDFEEFLILMSSKKPSSNDPDKELRDAFAVFDADGSGSISRSELKKLMKNLGQSLSDAELDAMMDEVDTDGNGEIDFEEFKTMMQS